MDPEHERVFGHPTDRTELHDVDTEARLAQWGREERIQRHHDRVVGIIGRLEVLKRFSARATRLVDRDQWLVGHGAFFNDRLHEARHFVSAAALAGHDYEINGLLWLPAIRHCRGGPGQCKGRCARKYRKFLGECHCRTSLRSGFVFYPTRAYMSLFCRCAFGLNSVSSLLARFHLRYLVYQPTLCVRPDDASTFLQPRSKQWHVSAERPEPPCARGLRSEEPFDFSGCIQHDRFRRRYPWQARHCHDLTADRDDKTRAR